MAATKSKRQSKAPAKRADTEADSDDELTQSQDASQGISPDVIEAVMRKQKEQAKSRRAQREQEIEANRQHRLSKVQQKMDECRRIHKADLENLRKPKIERMRALLAKKRELEAELDQCCRQVDTWQEATIQQIQVALDHRLEILKDEED